MKSISQDLVAALEVFPEVPPTVMRTLRYMKSCVYDDGVHPVYLPLWKQVAGGLRASDEPKLLVSEQVFRS